jgi:hypothetical protein
LLSITDFLSLDCTLLRAFRSFNAQITTA